MRRSSTLRLPLLALLLGVLCVETAHAREVTHLDFAVPQKKKAPELETGAPLPEASLGGLSLEGEGALRVARAPAPYAFAAVVPAAGKAVLPLTLPNPATFEGGAKSLDAALWRAVVSVDVLGLAAEGEAQVQLLVVPARGRTLKSDAAKIVSGVAAAPNPSEGDTTESPRRAQRTATRLWVLVPADVVAADAETPLTVRIETQGSAAVVIDDVRVHLFHTQPTRKLLGKPNGKNGPDTVTSGALGFTFLAEHEASAFSLLAVREGGPAQKSGLRPTDIVIAVEDRPLSRGSLAAGTAWFEHGHEATLGRAVADAIPRPNRGLSVTVLRSKGPRVLRMKVPHRKPLEASLTGAKTWEALHDDVLKWIVERQKKNGFWPGNEAVNSSLAGLALLGTRDRKYRPAIRKLAKAFMSKHPKAADIGGFSFWAIGFQGMFLSEYYLASGDAHALKWIEETIQWLPSTTHPSKWGMPAFGHSPKGLPYDSKALMAPCAHLLVFEALALRCGVESGVWTHIRPYVVKSWSDPKTKKGHGGMGYNPSYKDKAEFWSRTGLTALALHLRDDEPRMQEGMVTFMAARHPWMLNSHAYGEPGGALGLLALATVHPEGLASVLPAWHWKFLNAWEPGYGLRYSTAHMGAPYMGEDEIMNVAYGFFLAARTRGLVMAGGEATRWLK